MLPSDTRALLLAKYLMSKKKCLSASVVTNCRIFLFYMLNTNTFVKTEFIFVVLEMRINKLLRCICLFVTYHKLIKQDSIQSIRGVQV